MKTKYKINIVFDSELYADPFFMKLICKCAKRYHSTGSIIHFKGEDPKLNCSIKDLSKISDIIDLFEDYDIKIEIYNL